MKPYTILLALLFLALVLSLAVGSVGIPLRTLAALAISRIPTGSETFATIFYQLRLPRTVLVALTGAALAGSGAAYQGLFRNPLADPYLIGVASGAGLGAVIAMSANWPYTSLGLLAVPVAAFLAGLLTVALVYLIARSGPRGALSTTTLILAGIALGSFANALTSYLMLRSQGELHRAIAWLLGGSAQSGWGPVMGILPYVALGLVGLIVAGHPLNVMQFGDEQAQQLGLNVERARLLIILAASLASAAAVAYSGIIGFVGLVVPHLIRLFWGIDYRRLIPLSIIGGAALLLFADVLARWVLSPQELPVGVITALAGGPFFLWVLNRTRRISDF